MVVINYSELFNKYRILVDTSSFLCTGAEEFFIHKAERELKNSNKKFIIQYKVAEEINLLTDSEDEKARERAKKAVKLVNYMYFQGGTLEHYGTEEDSYTDTQFLKIFTQFGKNADLALITQDRSLAKSILGIKNQNDITSTKDIAAFRVSDDGNLVNWEELIKEKKVRTVSTRCFNCHKWFKENKWFIDKLYDNGKKVYCPECKKLFIPVR
ncbi:hypothetical protein P8V03_09205 [Clostridium sp. A1-XYC3]|uniref:PIN domain-containing protein n=1 Tax=Clostridium tanneri TaxID=3037988 RepID=A0ABU4JT98_9CLOT|nr:hypothetical protein [Clostridium sp. A1-XYC3]MDW8801331.1 hypothetical protein [Clostridium sp. A1-XYC3]